VVQVCLTTLRRKHNSNDSLNNDNKNDSSSNDPNQRSDATGSATAVFVENKYWAQRKRLFRRYDDGIQLDREGWFSVTPEVIANHIAERMCAHVSSSSEEENDDDDNMQEPKQKLVVLDAFTGVGGNVIAFALRPEVDRVICVDFDPNRLQMAAHNCRVYEIPPEKLVFVCADACDVLQHYQNGKLCPTTSSDPATEQEGHRKSASDNKPHSKNQSDRTFGGIELLPDRIDAIFLSPPWGGPNYEDANGSDGFDLQCIRVNDSCNGEDLLRYAKEALSHQRDQSLAYFLPRNVNGIKVGQSAVKVGLGGGGSLELEQTWLNSKLKTVTAYFHSKSKPNCVE